MGDGQKPADAYTKSPFCEPNSSGELKRGVEQILKTWSVQKEKTVKKPIRMFL